MRFAIAFFIISAASQSHATLITDLEPGEGAVTTASGEISYSDFNCTTNGGTDLCPVIDATSPSGNLLVFDLGSTPATFDVTVNFIASSLVAGLGLASGQLFFDGAEVNSGVFGPPAIASGTFFFNLIMSNSVPFDVRFDFQTGPTRVPEPSTLGLLGFGLLGLGFIRRRRAT